MTKIKLEIITPPGFLQFTHPKTKRLKERPFNMLFVSITSNFYVKLVKKEKKNRMDRVT